MGGLNGGGSCPGCGAEVVRPGQLVCQGCYVPFALMPARPGGADDPDPTSLQPEALEAPQAGPGGETTPTPGCWPVRPPVRPSRRHRGGTRRETPPLALRLRFPGGQTVSVEPGEHIRLGREPRLCPAVAFLAGHDNLSRPHATVAVAPDGSATVTDEGSTNGTYVRGYRLAAQEPAPLLPGDTLRLAADVKVSALP